MLNLFGNSSLKILEKHECEVGVARHFDCARCIHYGRVPANENSGDLVRNLNWFSKF